MGLTKCGLKWGLKSHCVNLWLSYILHLEHSNTSHKNDALGSKYSLEEHHSDGSDWPCIQDDSKCEWLSGHEFISNKMKLSPHEALHPRWTHQGVMIPLMLPLHYTERILLVVKSSRCCILILPWTYSGQLFPILTLQSVWNTAKEAAKSLPC